jgi:hydroxymethylpyrimidine pyrophosphatase-like HAD family hydrolase
MVCAGGCERVYKQMSEFPIDILGFYGMQFSTIKDGLFSIVENNAVPVNREQILNKAKIIRDEFDFLEYYGESVEFHASGMVTFPILGTTAPLDKKLAYDPYREKRRQCYSRVKEIFSDYTVFIGGTSSFDIVPKPFNKLHAIDKYLNTNGFNRSEVLFFGDDYGIGGNDSDVYESDIDFVCIDNYKDFLAIAEGRLT